MFVQIAKFKITKISGYNIFVHLRTWRVYLDIILSTASEWKAFLFYYGPATLYGILPDQFYVHFMILVKAIGILLAESIVENDLVVAEKLLRKFYKCYEEYYGM